MTGAESPGTSICDIQLLDGQEQQLVSVIQLCDSKLQLWGKVIADIPEPGTVI